MRLYSRACDWDDTSERGAAGLSKKYALVASNSGAAMISLTGFSLAARSSRGKAMSEIGLMSSPLCKPSRRISSSLALRRSASAAMAPPRAATSCAKRTPRAASRRVLSTTPFDGTGLSELILNASCDRRCERSRSGPADPQQHAAGTAAAHHVERGIDVVEREFVGDQALERQPPGFDQPDQPRDVDVRHRIAAVRPGQDFVEMDRQCVDRNLLARHADQHAGAVGMGEVIGELDHRFRAGGLDHLVGTFGADDLADLRVHIRHRIAVEAMGGAPALRHVELGVDQIDGNDRIGAGKLGKLYDVQSDAADAEDHHGFADLDVGVVVNDAGGGGHGAP